MKIGMETETLELKKSTSELKEACISICAMLNKHGVACVYFGVNNDGEIIGQECGKDTLRKISQRINEFIEPKVVPTIEDFEFYGANIISVKVTGTDRPYSVKGKYYIRSADEDRQIGLDELCKLYNEDTYSSTWEKGITEHSIENIDNNTLDKFNSDVTISKRLANAESIMQKFDLQSGNNLTNAGYVMFGKGNSAGEMSGPVHLKMGIFASNEKIKLLDLQNYEDNIYNLIEIAQTYIYQHIKWEAKISGIDRIDIPEIPAEAIREAVINNFLHARYDTIQQHEISIFPNKITITNPGQFTDKYNPYDYIDKTIGSVIRNNIIARSLYVSGKVEQFGTGLKKISKLCNEANVKYSFVNDNYGFSINFYRSDYYNKMTDLEKEVLGLISQDNSLTYEQIAFKTQKSSRTIQRAFSSLKQKSLIGRQGSKKTGKWIIL